jgi:serine/threonine protein kinase/Tfp pilus assembly protein PilF
MADSLPAAHPPAVPDYELLRCIGRGSYGDVWLARNVLGQCRAVKFVYRSRFIDPRPFEREFEGIQRFEPISRSHPSQLHILHVGKNDAAGCFYYVMELADDANAPVAADVRRLTSPGARVSSPAAVPHDQTVSDTLSRLPSGVTAAAGDSRGPKLEPPHVGCYEPHTLRSDLEHHGRLPIPDCVQIGLSLATALAHLHGQGLVHRDIKPSNIIFVNGVAKLGDIGLVTDSGDTQSIVGTEGYLPPEGPGTPQADLYSLGKVLYEISTGLDRRRFAALPEDSWNWPDRDPLMEFNEIVLRACAKDPAQRYETADQLRADLALLQEGKSVRHARGKRRLWSRVKQVVAASILLTIAVAMYNRFVASGILSLPRSRAEPLNPMTTGKNVGGYPPTLMRGTTNVEAWNYYRLGYADYRRWTPDRHTQAMRNLNKAIEIDPNFALAHYSLWMEQFSDTRLLTHAKTDEFRRLADKLVQLDSGLAETHVVLGLIRFWEWQWAESEAENREALRLNPDCVHASVLFGFMLSHVGRTAEALQVLDLGLRVDPNEPQLVKMKGHAYFVRRQFQEALDLYQESIRREPLFGEGRTRAARAFIALTNYPAAIDEMEKLDLSKPGDPVEVRRKYSELRRAFQENGARGYWLKELESTRQRLSPHKYPYTYAGLYARLGDKEQALAFLEKSYERHDELVYLIMDEFWDPWRDEPRFEAIRKKTGLPRHPNFPAK